MTELTRQGVLNMLGHLNEAYRLTRGEGGLEPSAAFHIRIARDRLLDAAVGPVRIAQIDSEAA